MARFTDRRGYCIGQFARTTWYTVHAEHGRCSYCGGNFTVHYNVDAAAWELPRHKPAQSPTEVAK